MTHHVAHIAAYYRFRARRVQLEIEACTTGTAGKRIARLGVLLTGHTEKHADYAMLALPLS